MTVTAKPIVKDHSWVITSNGCKIGNIEVNSRTSGYNVRIGDRVNYFSSTADIEANIRLTFAEPPPASRKVLSFAKWPVDGETHNDYYDVTRGVHAFTKTPNASCYYVAGYFAVEQNGIWSVVETPKYLTIKRQPYFGPFQDSEQAQRAINQNAAK